MTEAKTDRLEQAKREIAAEWREYQQFIGKQVPRQSTICADWTQRHLEAERARNLELREALQQLYAAAQKEVDLKLCWPFFAKAMKATKALLEREP
jgi:uncharacterized protein YigA (DUF484 family)